MRGHKLTRDTDQLSFNGYTYGGVRYELLRYGDGTLAIRLWVPGDLAEQEPLTTISVNLTAYGATPLFGFSFFLKDYAENVGIREALLELGVIAQVPGSSVTLPYGQVVNEFMLEGEWLERFQLYGHDA